MNRHDLDVPFGERLVRVFILIDPALMQEPQKAVEEMISNVEGDFALIIVEPGRIIVGRDSMGAQPLYYGENSTYAALGSNRRVLWRLGIGETQSFPPGHLGWITNKGIRLKRVRTISFSEPKLDLVAGLDFFQIDPKTGY